MPIQWFGFSSLIDGFAFVKGRKRLLQIFNCSLSNTKQKHKNTCFYRCSSFSCLPVVPVHNYYNTRSLGSIREGRLQQNLSRTNYHPSTAVSQPKNYSVCKCSARAILELPRTRRECSPSLNPWKMTGIEQRRNWNISSMQTLMGSQ